MRIYFKRQFLQLGHFPRKKCLIILLFGISLSLISLFYLLQWNIICLNAEIDMHLNLLCHEYQQGKAHGNLCRPICETGDVSVLSCQSMHKGKVAVFTAEWNGTIVVIKSHREKSDYMPLYWTDNSNLIFPNYEELVEMISQSLKLNFGVYLDDAISTLFPFFETESEKTVDLMTNLWQLSQDNEYVMLMTNQHSKMFPKILSTCGTFYAVEYAKPIPVHLKTDKNLRILHSKQILELLMKLASFQDPIHICDVKLEHFGLIGDHMVVIDVDTVFPRSVVERSTSDGRKCKQHQDCYLFDCQSLCNEITERCDKNLINNNLQLICEKIFLNSGLLLSGDLPGSQQFLIEKCAISGDPGTEAYYANELLSYFNEYLRVSHF